MNDIMSFLPHKTTLPEGFYKSTRMSSRALRKIQKQTEQQRPLESAAPVVSGIGSDCPLTPPGKNINTFDMLGDTGLEEEEKDEDDAVPEDDFSSNPQSARTGLGVSAASAKKKKGKKKSKRKQQDGLVSKANVSKEVNTVDEIDLALKALSPKPTYSTSSPALESAKQDYEEPLGRLLAIENKHLNAMNEMRKLFGSVALENNPETTLRRPQRGGVIHLDLGSALTAQYSPVSKGQGLTGFALRRNIFMNGKEEWPRATSGGLEMGAPVISNMSRRKLYSYEHNAAYRDIQRQFESCVASMDPQRMITLLQYNPYHISTMLQVSEIAKQQGDHSVSGDLLERALFTFGRSVHSTFPSALVEGTARLHFSYFENREFGLATWRYIDNLGQRGTWRTAYEWAKLLWALDPIADPYSILLFLDSIAIRGGQAEHFLALTRALREAYLESPWPRDDPRARSVENSVDNLALIDFAKCLSRPNLAISSVLAKLKIGRDRRECVWLLALCVRTWPFIFLRLFQELNVDPIPRAVWGRVAVSDQDRLGAESYAQYAKDIWNTPDHLALLTEVANNVSSEDVGNAGHEEEPITIDEARHLLLSGRPSLMGLIPREFSRLSSSASDPLPPRESVKYWSEDEVDSEPHVSPFDPENLDAALGEAPPTGPASRETNDERRELEGLQSWFSRFWRGNSASSAEENDTELDRVAEESGVPQEVIMTRQTRLVQLAQRLLGIGAYPEASRNDASNTAIAPSGASTDVINQQGEQVREEDHSGDNLRNPPTEESRLDNAPSSAGALDMERTKRYLAGAGMLALREFIAQHGGDMTRWEHESAAVYAEGKALFEGYAAKARTLNERDRKFILDYPLAQGAGQDARRLVLNRLDR